MLVNELIIPRKLTQVLLNILNHTKRSYNIVYELSDFTQVCPIELLCCYQHLTDGEQRQVLKSKSILNK